NISSGGVRTYRASTDTFSAALNSNTYLDNCLSAVNGDGSRVAVEFPPAFSQPTLTSVLDGSLGVVEQLPTIDGGMAFDPTRNVLYGVNSATDQLVAFDTTTWAEKYRIPVGENMPASAAFGSGVITPDPTGRVLYLSTPTGVRVLALPAATGVASRLTLGGFPAFLPVGTPGTFTVTALDPDGNVATGFTGTVAFSASGGTTTLPANYTFTTADAGRHTFTASFGTAAAVALPAPAAGRPAGSQAGIQVHNQAVVGLIPVADRRGMVYDTARDLLYIATDHGTVERYSPTTRTLLAPWKVGNALK